MCIEIETVAQAYHIYAYSVHKGVDLHLRTTLD